MNPITIQSLEKKERILNKRRKRIDKIKTSKGCEECGYDENPYALDFAHTDPLDKLGKNMYDHVIRYHGKDKEKNRSFIRILFTEIRKCRILCAICHRIETKERRESYKNKETYTSRTGKIGDKSRALVKYPNLAFLIVSYRRLTDRRTRKPITFTRIQKLLEKEHGISICRNSVLRSWNFIEEDKKNIHNKKRRISYSGDDGRMYDISGIKNGISKIVNSDYVLPFFRSKVIKN